MSPVMSRVQVGRLQVAESLHRWVRESALPGTGLDEDNFWAGAADVIAEFGPRIREALARRAELQEQIDDFHRAHPGAPDPATYRRFLEEIGYLVPEPDGAIIDVDHVDPEIATVAGPQLVVPILNARFATNAANARWGSLYDALYGSDVIPDEGDLARGRGYNATRGAEVVRRARAVLDEHLPLDSGSHADATAYRVDDEGLAVHTADGLRRLADPAGFRGHQGEADDPSAILLRHHGLHLEIQVDRDDPIGRDDTAGVKDLVLEAAVTTIMDLEDSVAAVDAEDKVLGYDHWLRLMQRSLSETVTKGEETFERKLAEDRTYIAPEGRTLTLAGRALLFVRQVGHLMTTDAILDADGEPVPEGVLDALMTALGSLHDLKGRHAGGNSRTGSVYVVKPKMHGPDEVAITRDLFSAVERVTRMPQRTIKIGIMDEERRTSVNLEACIAEARERVVFINTGFLDRTGDEIHTSMLAGPMVRKAEMKQQPWIEAYESANVRIGLACGLFTGPGGHAQIGKGMWAAPDELADMMEQKIGHPEAGASTAWVPSPTAATLHALHYHRVDVAQRQQEIARTAQGAGDVRRLDALLTIPLGDPADWSAEDRTAEVDNNAQGVLGYVVRWVDAGIGCSKVPDLHGTALMEDRATCRISSQHIANWLHHGVVTADEVEESLRRMAAVVDEQNAGDPDYLPMGPEFDGHAFQAARDLIFHGTTQPSGYTEPTLHRHRRQVKDGVQRT